MPVEYHLMPETEITAAILCREVVMPDDPRGQADLIGVVQDLAILAGGPDYFNGMIYVAFEGPDGTYSITVRWTNETSGQAYGATGTVEAASGSRAHRGMLPVALYCVEDGTYSLEIGLGGSRCSQSVRVRRQQPEPT